ncbi:hypothetical protein HMI55_003648, partial [Coelomomyces lativittatus]
MTNTAEDLGNNPGDIGNQGQMDSHENTKGSSAGGHRVQSFGLGGCQFAVPQYNEHRPTPNPQEYAIRGNLMDWFSSNHLNPFVLLTYEGGSFAAYVEKFMRIVKRYEHLLEEDR